MNRLDFVGYASLSQHFLDFDADVLEVLGCLLDLGILTCLTVEEVEERVDLFEANIIYCELNVGTDHQLLEVFELHVVVFCMLERDDVLFNALDLVLGVLDNDLVVLILDIS